MKVGILVRTVRTLAVLAGTVMTAAAAPPLQVTDQDVRLAKEKASAALADFIKTWLPYLGSQKPPRVQAYEKTVNTKGCKQLGPNNAYYCSADNTIYFDELFLAELVKVASARLGTSGDYAAVVVTAHEFGHALAFANLPPVMGGGTTVDAEPIADCFAGAITRQAKNQGSLENGNLSEGLLMLALLGDNPSAESQMLMLAMGQAVHGDPDQRMAGFLRGYYGGPTFCLDTVGRLKPPSPVRLIASVTSVSSSVVSPEATHACTWSNGPDGLRVRNSAAAGSCKLSLLPGSTLLPDHVRIEFTVTSLDNRITRRRSRAGIYHGDGRSTNPRTVFSFETGPAPNPEYVDAKLEAAAGNPPVRGGFFPAYYALSARVNKVGENRLMLDIHHEGKDVYFQQYVNGGAGYFGLFQGTLLRRLGVPTFHEASDEAGVWLREPGDEAVFRDFRVSALSK
jgi:predicted metalloprotease